MPWLYRPSSSKETMRISDTSRSPVLPGTAVTFIPSMMDMSCGTSPVHLRMTPIGMMMDDVKVITLNMMRCLPEITMSMWSMDFGMRMFRTWMDARDSCLQMILIMVELWGMITCIPILIFMPGMVSIMLCAIFACCVMVLSMPMNGDQVMRCSTPSACRLDKFSDERWIYINGSMTGSRQLRCHLERLSTIFGRPMTAIHNRTYGLLFDLMFNAMVPIMMSSSASVALHEEIRDALLSLTCRKIIVIAHGTGANLLSHTMDMLYADLPMDLMRKMEIYTFGATAKHMSNPCRVYERSLGKYLKAGGSIANPAKANPGTPIMRMEENERVVSHIEHYIIGKDVMARCGIMHHTMNLLNNNFCGRMFIINRSGFTFPQYMDMMFLPMGGNHKKYMSSRCILDDVPEIDILTAEKREFTAHNGIPLEPMAMKMLDGIKCGRRASWKIGEDDIVSMARMCAKEYEGMTVRQLSRLWRYAGGSRPVGEGAGVMNGVGLGVSMDMIPGMDGITMSGNDMKDIDMGDMKSMSSVPKDP